MITSALGFIIVAIVTMASGIDLGGLFSFLGLSDGAIMAFAAVAGAPAGTIVTTDQEDPDGTVTTTEQMAKSELLENTVSQRITEMRPSSTPLDTIIRKNSIVVPIKSWETEYFAVDMRGIQDSVTEELDPIPEDDTATDIKVANVHIWTVDDVVKFNGLAGSDGYELVANVVDIDPGDKEIKVVFLNPKDHPDSGDDPKIEAGQRVTRIGNAKGEKDAQTDPYAILPQLTSNYCQIHMAQVEESVYAKLHKKKVKWDIEDYKLQALYDMRRNMELTSLFGFKHKFYDVTGKKEKYLSGGITRYIDKVLDYPSNGEIDNDIFVDWTKAIFTGNSGSDRRFLFAGDNLMAALNKVDTYKKQMEAKSTELVHGITFSLIKTSFGELLVKHHPLLNFADWGDCGVVLDMNNIEKHVLKPMSSRTLDLIKSGQRNVNAYLVDEAFCLVLRYPETHALIGKQGSEPWADSVGESRGDADPTEE